MRDAAHEACHAIHWGVPEGAWGRESIHDHCPVDGLLASEVLARAVERIVYERITTQAFDANIWLMMAALEFSSTYKVYLPLQQWRDAVEEAMSTPQALELTERVIALASDP